MFLHLHREQSLSYIRVIIDLDHTAVPEIEPHFTLERVCTLTTVLVCISQRE